MPVTATAEPAQGVQPKSRVALYLALIGIVYFAAACGAAHAKLVWYDEFFTLYLSRLRTLGDIWRALAGGATNDAPLNYILPRLSAALFGGGTVAFRLPAMLGVAVFCACLFVYVSRRCGRLAGFVALLLPLSTEVRYYATEARPYGDMLGCAGLAFLCWTQTGEGRRRGLWLAGLALSLAAAVSTHYVSVLLWIPLAAGEGVRSWRRRYVDWPVWLALAAGAVPLLFFLPLIRASHQYSAHIWEGASLFSVPETYRFLLAPLLAPMAAALVLLFLPWQRREDRDGDGRPRIPLPPAETVAAISLALLPLFGLLLGKLVTGTYVPRYALASVAGITILLTAAVSAKPRVTAILAFVLTGSFWFNSIQALKGWTADPAREYRTLQLPTNLPVVVSNADLFLKLAEYGPPALRPRLIFLHDPAAALRFLGNDTGERNMEGLKRATALPIVDYAAFLRTHSRFLVYGGFINRFDWLIQQLRADGARVAYLSEVRGSWLFEVTAPYSP
jgi:Dolichyl-phosphate-mannose-protein mannosyltransferase